MNALVTPYLSQIALPIHQNSAQILSSQDTDIKLASKYASLTTTSRFLGGGSGTSSTPSASLTPIEGQALANYLEQHRRHWLWSRHVEHQWRYAGPFPINAERHNPKV
ncbi:hypothetical protein N7455_000872 [Penicillium solitum]|uniref:uncharacterized protein n=1 Tax=Penicillium solitum TaxID=60172 RepID=UPI0017CE5845|nr:hypothetical protein HAV15_007522 [Penicillium sp. str. \